MKRLFLLFVVALLPLLAQQTPPAPTTIDETIKSTAEEVVIDVVIRDKRGRPVTDVKAEEVTVVDNGEKQKVKSFRLVEGKAAIEAGQTKTLDPLRQVRLVTLVFEALSNDQQRIAKQAALDLLKGDQGQNTFYSVVGIWQSMNILQPFTNDKDLLRKAVEVATNGKYLQFPVEGRRVREQIMGRMQQQAATAPAAGVNSAPGQTPVTATSGASPEVDRRMNEIMRDTLRYEESLPLTEATRTSIYSLMQLARSQAQMPGRKTILYFSQGMWVPPHLDEAFRAVMSTANRGNISFYSVDTRGVMTGGQNSTAIEEMKAAARASAEDVTRDDGRVSKEALMASDRAEVSMRNNVQAPLRDLAESTGGFLIGDSNDLRTPLRQVNEEVNSYYEVSYNPQITNYDGAYRKTEVHLEGRKDLRIHARSGYFALPADVRSMGLMPYEIPLLKALQANPMPRDLEFRSTTLRFNGEGGKTVGSLIVEVPMSVLQFREDPVKKVYAARLSIMSTLKNQQGEIVQKFTRDFPFETPADRLAMAKAINFVNKDQFEVPAGRYTVETAVIDRESLKIGAKKSVFAVTTKPAGVRMSSIVMVKNFEQNVKVDASEPLQYNGGRIAPSLTNTIYPTKGAILGLFFVVYPDKAAAEKPQLTVEYLKDGQVVGKAGLELPAPDATGKIPYVLSSPADAFPPGQYEVRAVIQQGQSATEDRAFITVAEPKASASAQD